MVMDTAKLRAAIFERTGVAIDEQDPIMAVLAMSAMQTEEIGAHLLARTRPVRLAAITATTALTFALLGAAVAWHIGQQSAEGAGAHSVRQDADPRRAALLGTEEGKAALRLAELGVATLLLQCTGRRSWRIEDGYCVPMTRDGRPDGFRVTGRVRVAR